MSEGTTPTKEHQDQEQAELEEAVKTAIDMALAGLGPRLHGSAVIVVSCGCCVSSSLAVMPTFELKPEAPQDKRDDYAEFLAIHLVRRLSQVAKSYEQLIGEAAARIGVTSDEILRRVDAELANRAAQGAREATP